MDIFAKNIVLAYAAFVMAFIITCITIRLVIIFSHHLELFDTPNERKIHSGKISRLGGIGIFLGFLISVSISPFLVGVWMRTPFAVYVKVFPKMLFIIPTVMMFVIGLADDFRSIRAYVKLSVQILGALIVIFAGARIQIITIPFIWKTVDLAFWSWPISFIWIIGITNAINLIDGMDGLAAIISIIGFSVYSLIFLLDNHFILAIVSFVMVGTLLGYLLFNFPPARVFMGDSGSLVLGFLLAVLPLVAQSDTGTFMYTPVTLLLIPIADVFSAIIRRARKRISFAVPDKEHFHHKLLALGLNERFILILTSAVMLITSVPLVLYLIKPAKSIGVWIIIDWMAVISAFIALHFIYHNRKAL